MICLIFKPIKTYRALTKGKVWRHGFFTDHAYSSQVETTPPITLRTAIRLWFEIGGFMWLDKDDLKKIVCD